MDVHVRVGVGVGVGVMDLDVVVVLSDAGVLEMLVRMRLWTRACCCRIWRLQVELRLPQTQTHLQPTCMCIQYLERV